MTKYRIYTIISNVSDKYEKLFWSYHFCLGKKITGRAACPVTFWHFHGFIVLGIQGGRRVENYWKTSLLSFLNLENCETKLYIILSVFLMQISLLVTLS